MHAPPPNHHASPLDRFLRLFTDVRAGESTTALLLAANIFLILTAYYVLRVVREVLILRTGAASASYSAAGQALLLLVAVPAYGALAGRFPRRKLINGVTLFFVACLGAFFALATLEVPVGVGFYIWLGIFNVMLVAQFWGFANDVYTNDEGKRLFPLVGFGASSGAVFGSWLTGVIEGTLGLYETMLVAAGLLMVAMILTNLVDARERRRTEWDVPDVQASGVRPAATSQIRTAVGKLEAPGAAHMEASGTFRAVGRDRGDAAKPEVPVSTGNAFQIVWRNRYLLLMAMLVLLLNWVNTNGEYILRETVARAADSAVANGTAESRDQFISGFYSNFLFVMNIVSLFMQLFLVSRIIKYLGVRIAIFILPLVAVANYTVLAFLPILAIVRWAKTIENATDYSLNNTVRNVLFLPTTREEKYKAKQVTDSFSQRAGDVLHALTIFVGLNYLGFGREQFAILTIVLAIAWLAVAYLIGRRYRRLAATMEESPATL